MSVIMYNYDLLLSLINRLNDGAEAISIMNNELFLEQKYACG